MNNSAKYCFRNTNRIKLIYVSGIVFFCLAFAVGLILGSTRLSFMDAFTQEFITSADGRILFYVRLPRTLASLVCGGALAASGGVIQAVLDNRLASPGIIGVNAGAGLAVTLCTALGILSGWGFSLSAFMGALFAVMLVSLGAKKWGASRGTVILIGVALNSFLGAVSDSVVTFMPEVGVMSNDFKVGEFSAVTFEKLVPSSVLIIVALIIILSLNNELDVLTLGDENATGLGMNTKVFRCVFMGLSALLAGCAVSLAGLLSFVGLVVPHIIRRFAGNKSLHLVLLSFIFGGAFVCLCDTFSRTAFSPYEIPVGIIMAFIGAPFFIFILIKGKGGHSRG